MVHRWRNRFLLAMRRFAVLTKQTGKPLGISAIFLTISLVVFRKILAAPGVASSYAEWIFPPFSEQLRQWMDWEFFLWRPPDLGIYTTGATTSLYADHLLIDLLARVGFDGDIISKIDIVLVLALAGCFMYYLCRSMKINTTAAVLGGMFYMLTPAIFDRFAQGHVILTLEYALLPLALALFANYLEEKRSLKYLVGAGLVIALANISLVGMFILWSIITLYCVFYLLHTRKKREIIFTLKALTAIFSIFLLVHSFWIIPLSLRFIQAELGGSIASHFAEWPISTIAKISSYNVPEHAVRLLGFHVGYFWHLVKGNPWWQYAGYLPAVMVFFAFLFRLWDRRVIFFGLLSILGIIFVSFPNLIGGDRYLSLLENVPILRILRDPSRLIFFTCIGYAVLIGIITDTYQNYLRKSLQVPSMLRLILGPLLRKLIPVVVVTLIIGSPILAYGYPFLSGNLGGFMEPLDYGQDNEQLFQQLYREPGDFRVFSLPSPGPIQYPGQKQTTRDMMSYYAGKPSLSFTSAYQPPIVPFLFRTAYDKKTEYFGKLLGLANVKYLIFDPTKKTTATDIDWVKKVFPEMRLTNEKIARMLSEQKDITLLETIGQIQLWENNSYQPHIFPASQIGLYVGGLDGLVSLSYREDLEPGKLPLVFLSQLSHEEFQQLVQMPNVKIIIQEGHLPDLLLATVSEEYVLSPVPYFEDSSPDNGWAPLRWFWHRWHYQTTLEHAVFTLVNSRLRVPYNAEAEDDYVVYLKTFLGPKASSIAVHVDEAPLGKTDTKTANEAGFQWIDIGKVHLTPGEHEFSFTSEAGENAISQFAIVPQRIMTQAMQETRDLIEQHQVILISELNRPYLQPTTTIWSKNSSELLDTAKKTASRWPRGEHYTVAIQDDTFVTTVNFNQSGDANESLSVMFPSFSPLELKESTVFEFVYKVDNPKVQDFVLYLELDTDGDGKGDETYRLYGDKRNYIILRMQQSTVYHRFQFKLYEVIQELFPERETYHITNLWMTFRKYPGTDASGERGGKYNFYVKECILGNSNSWLISPKVTEIVSQGTALSNPLLSTTPLEYNLPVPKAGYYNLLLRAASDNGSSQLNVTAGDLKGKMILPSLEEGFGWREMGPVFLPESTVHLYFTPEGSGRIYLDELLLIEETSTSPPGGTVALTHDRINPTKYSIQAHAEEPFYLFFSENYHDQWRLHFTDGTQQRGYPGYSFGNLFFINRTGDFTMQLEFTEQRIYTIALIFSIACFCFLLLWLIFPNRLLGFIQQKIRLAYHGCHQYWEKE